MRFCIATAWRMEARGEIRGGRFVSSFAGEQFALPDAITELRKIKTKQSTAERVVVSAADPLNLVGIITPDEKIPATLSNRILYENGVPLAALKGDEIIMLGSSGNAEVPVEIRAGLIQKVNKGGRRAGQVSWLK